jgi:magnesium-dependent phosphatase 1
VIKGSKTVHLTKLQKQSGVDFADMLFFDDEARNRNVEAELGVLMYLVRGGVTNDEVDRAVREWRSKRGKSGSYVV